MIGCGHLPFLQSGYRSRCMYVSFLQVRDGLQLRAPHIGTLPFRRAGPGCKPPPVFHRHFRQQQVFISRPVPLKHARRRPRACLSHTWGGV